MFYSRFTSTTLFAFTLATAVVCGPSVWQLHANPPGGSGHGFHVPMPDQEIFAEFRVTDGDETKSTELVLKLPTASAQAKLDQAIALPGGLGTATLKRYLPQAKRVQDAVDDPKGHPAILLDITGKTQSFERWLVADDTAHNRLTSLLGTWRYQAVDTLAQREALYEQFATEYTQPPRLLIGPDTKAVASMPAQPDQFKAFDDLGCKITVLKFFPHFGYDEKTKAPINRSAKRVNPAALVRIEHDGPTEERWVFSKFPDYQAQKGSAAEIRVRLICPAQAAKPTPDFVVVTTKGQGTGKEKEQTHEVWTRQGDKTTRVAFTQGAKIEIPESNYTFSWRQYHPRARLEERYTPNSEKRGSVTALNLTLNLNNSEPVSTWVALGSSKTISTDSGVVTVIFNTRAAGAK